MIGKETVLIQMQIISNGYGPWAFNSEQMIVSDRDDVRLLKHTSYGKYTQILCRIVFLIRYSGKFTADMTIHGPEKLELAVTKDRVSTLVLSSNHGGNFHLQEVVIGIALIVILVAVLYWSWPSKPGEIKYQELDSMDGAT